MIIDEYVEVLVKQPGKYKKLGYRAEYGETILIKIEDLSSGSHIKVNFSCDFCGKTSKSEYRRLDSNKHCCTDNDCTSKKSRETQLLKYGVDNYSKTNECKEKMSKTIKNKYGIEHYSQTDEYKEKIRKTNIQKYGVEHYSKTNEYKERVKNTSLNKYGQTSYRNTDEYKESYKNTCLDKYGVEHYSKTDEYKEKVKNTSIDRYNETNYTKTDEYKERYKNTCLEKYGVENIFQSLIHKEKIKNYNLELYGVYHYSKTNEYKEKIIETCLEKYGVKSIFQSDTHKDKIRNTCLEKYGVNNITKSEYYHEICIIGNNINYIKYLNNNISLFNCQNKHTFEISSSNYFNRLKSNIPLCTICNPIGDTKSIKEKELLEFIQKNYTSNVISGYRDGLEIDIYLPELKIGFEFNGLYWHSDNFKESNYHINKTNYFKEKDIRIIHIWEDDWTFKQDIVKSQINNLLSKSDKIFARKCLIKEVSAKESRIFLDSNHIQGFTSSSFKIGLYYNDALVSIMTFDSFEGRKKMEEGGYNLSRFCNKLGYNVVGGASKLLSYFIKNKNVSRIVSYADRDWSIGDLYYKLGFESVGSNGPDYKYIIDGKRVHKSRYKKSRLNTTLTESQRMKELNINKVYDCGKIKFELKKQP